jgi:hypothetical protein
MTVVGTHGLTCLDSDDPAAVALSMQANAEAIDDALTGIDASIDAYLGRWWWSATNIAAMNVSFNSGTGLPEGLVGADLFTDGTLLVQANGFPATSSFPGTFDWPDGVYIAGTSIKWTVATPNNDTPRTLMIVQVNRFNGGAGFSNPNTVTYMSTEYEHSPVGNDGSVSCSGMFQVDSSMSRFAACFSHGNSSSVLVIPAGAWRLWFMRMGSGLVV